LQFQTSEYFSSQLDLLILAIRLVYCYEWIMKN